MNSVALKFENLVPIPLADFKHDGDIWQCNFDLSFPKRVLLNASSGKGKTTFSSILYGIRKDYSGKVLIDNQDISSFSLHQWIGLRKTTLGAIFQDLQLFPNLSAWENLVLKNNLTNHRTDEQMKAMLNRLGLLDRKDQVCKTLSYGQQQRVAIIRGLLQPYKLLLLDEPFSHLDEVNASVALDLIDEETKSNNAGYILTTLGSHHGRQYDLELKL